MSYNATNDMFPNSAAFQSLTGITGLSDWALNVGVGVARRYVRWHVAPVRVETFTTGPDECGQLRLPSLRLLNIIGLAGPSGPLVDGWRWHDHGLIVREGGVFEGGPAEWVVEVQHGFDVELVPDFVAVVGMIARRVESANATPIGAAGVLVEEQIGGYRYRLADASGAFAGDPSQLTHAEMALLDPYRIVLLP